MVEGINPVNNQAQMRLSQLLNEDLVVQNSSAIDPTGAMSLNSVPRVTGNAFEDMLSNAVEALNQVSQSEMKANDLISKYVKGEAELSDVMLMQSKAGIMVQLAVTTVNSAVTTFKELTQLQV